VTGIFKANNPSGNVIMFLYAIVLKLPLFLYSRSPQLQPLDGVLYKSLLQILNPIANSFVPTYSILTFILLFSQAIGFNKIVNDQRLHKQNNYLTGMSYLLVTSLFSDWFFFSAPLIVNSIMIWVWSRLCALYNNANPKATIFNIGLVTGISAFIYFPSICFLVLIIVGIVIARPFKLHEWLTVLLGITTPVYLYVAYLFLTDEFSSYNPPGFLFSYPHFFGNKWAYAALAIIFAALVIGMYYVNINMRRQIVHTRKSWQLLFLYFIVAALVPFINATINFSYWILLAVPASPIIAALFFYPKKKLVPLLFHWAMVAIFIVISFMMK
jgi:Family of unknown function (DUF6427)